jgi:hypothetical protein
MTRGQQAFTTLAAHRARSRVTGIKLHFLVATAHRGAGRELGSLHRRQVGFPTGRLTSLAISADGLPRNGARPRQPTRLVLMPAYVRPEPSKADKRLAPPRRGC